MQNALFLDWLSFSYHCDQNELDINMGEFELFFKAFPEFESIKEELIFVTDNPRFYDHVIAFNNYIRFYYCDEFRNQGVNVQITSHGLGFFCDLFGIDSDSENCISCIMQLLKSRNCKLSRIDLAYDDYTKTYTPHDYGRLWYEERFATKFRSFRFNSSQQTKGGTFYLGSRRNQKMLRIYDKDYESQGEIPAIRYEFELHGDNANDMMNYFLDNSTLDFASYLKDWFYILENKKSSYNNNHNFDDSVCPEWFGWLNHCVLDKFNAHIQIKKSEKDRTLDNFENYIEKQLMPSLKTYIELYGENAFFNLLKITEHSFHFDLYESLIKLRQKVVCRN